MFNIIKRRSTHASKLDGWLGVDQTKSLTAMMKDWYGPPIALAGVPGEVYCRGGGDFVGNIDAGAEHNYTTFAVDNAKRILRRASISSRGQMGAGFATLQAILDAAKTGKAQVLPYPASANSFTAGRACDQWASALPISGASGAAAPGGTVFNLSSTKALPIRNAQAGKNLYAMSSDFTSNINPLNTIVCDRLFAVAKTMSSTASEAVTGVPTRYQSTVSTDWDWCGGNFVYPNVTAGLNAVAHNHTVCQYTDQDGNTGQSFPSIAGQASTGQRITDLPTNTWFMPPDAGDVGVKAITQIQLDASVTGGIEYVLSHPMFIVTCPILFGTGVSTAGVTNNNINSAMQLQRIAPDACLYTYYWPVPGTFNVQNVTTTFVEG